MDQVVGAIETIRSDHGLPTAASCGTVKHFRQILLWPLQLMPLKESLQIHHHWELLRCAGDGPWEELLDEFEVDPSLFQERHYREFVTFLPHVQRFLYGEGSVGGSRAEYRESPLRAYRRKGVPKVRMVLGDRPEPVVLDVRHVDLYFFYDVDLVILALEIFGEDLPLEIVQDVMFLFGRAYPGGWTDDGCAFHCMKVEWLGEDGRVLATSDFEIERNSSPPSAGTGPPRSLPTGSTCSNRWSRIIQGAPVRFAIDSSSTIACRSWPIWRSKTLKL